MKKEEVCFLKAGAGKTMEHSQPWLIQIFGLNITPELERKHSHFTGCASANHFECTINCM